MAAGEKEKKDEPSKSDKRYGSKDKKDDSKEEKSESKAEEKKEESDGGEEKEAAADPHAEAMAAMMKRHQKEHRDLHGTHKDSMAKMFSRHQAEMAQMHQQMQGAGGDQDGMGGEPASEPGAQEQEAE